MSKWIFFYSVNFSRMHQCWELENIFFLQNVHKFHSGAIQ